MARTFAEKVLDAECGTIVFKRPDLVLSHDNTASIEKIFKKMQGVQPFDSTRLVITLDHNAPPTNVKLANDYQQIRKFVSEAGVERFHDVGSGICHQLMANYARPGMIVVGSDSHSCTAGAFNAFAAGIDRTETAGIWKTGETWFRVPESMKITLNNSLPPHVYSKDLALTIIGMIDSDGADYLSIEFHGDGLKSLTIEDRMTIANMASEMGAKNAVFPPDDILMEFLDNDTRGVWADHNAHYKREIEIDLDTLFPVVSLPHNVDKVKAVSEVAGTPIGQALIGTCTNGRISDLRIAAGILRGQKVASNVQLHVIPASRDIYLQAMKEGIIQEMVEAGANILSPSCGPCLGTGQGIPPDGINVISTANRNFLGRMGNSNCSIFLGSPATVALSAIKGEILSLGMQPGQSFKRVENESKSLGIQITENRRFNGVWAYQDVDNLNTDQMFAGNLTYEINSSDPHKIVPHLLKGFDARFAELVENGDIVICGENFGCGSSREHPSVGFVHAGVKAVIVKSVSRIFYRSAINQGLPIIVLPDAVNAYQPGDMVTVLLREAKVTVGVRTFRFNPLPEQLMEILTNGGLVKTLATDPKL